MNLLVTPKGFGNISDEQVKELKPSIFPCGKCSFEKVEIFHNLIGVHAHQDCRKLLSLIPSETLKEEGISIN